MSARPTTPPTTPPAIAPVLLEDFLDGAEVVVLEEVAELDVKLPVLEVLVGVPSEEPPGVLVGPLVRDAERTEATDAVDWALSRERDSAPREVESAARELSDWRESTLWLAWLLFREFTDATEAVDCGALSALAETKTFFDVDLPELRVGTAKHQHLPTERAN